MDATPREIVRCLKKDLGDINAAIRYADRIGWNQTRTGAVYREAAAILREEAATKGGTDD